jgi:hypothetical protein
MPRSLTSLVDNVATPLGTMVPETGTTVILSDEEFGLVSPSSLGVAWTDNGQTSDGADLVSAQATNVAAVGALTVSTVGTQTATNPAAVTAAAPGALTSTTIAAADADATYGQPEADLINEIKGDYTALRVDVTAIRAEVVKLVTDITATRAQVVALVTDVTEIFAKFDAGVTDLGTLRTALNDTLAALTGAGKPMAA